MTEWRIRPARVEDVLAITPRAEQADERPAAMAISEAAALINETGWTITEEKVAAPPLVVGGLGRLADRGLWGWALVAEGAPKAAVAIAVRFARHMLADVREPVRITVRRGFEAGETAARRMGFRRIVGDPQAPAGYSIWIHEGVT
jgi:hypothetical protein